MKIAPLTRFDHFDRVALSLLASFLLAVLGIIWLGRTSPPPISAYLPAPDTSLAVTGQVGIKFLRKMDIAQIPAMQLQNLQSGEVVPGTVTWQQDTLWFKPTAPLTPNTTYQAQIQPAQLQAIDGRTFHQALTWQVQVRPPELVYLAPVDGPRELWRLNPFSGEAAQQLTQTDGNIFDFGISKDGEWIAYSVINEKGGTDLWQMARDGSNAAILVNCQLDRCTEPAFAPDGSRIAYSREVAPEDPTTQPQSPPRLWTVELSTRRTAQLYQDSQVLGYNASFSPDGKYLAFFDAAQQGIRVLELANRKAHILPSWTGQVGTWSPDSKQMLYSEVVFANDTQSVTLLSANLASQATTPIDISHVGEISSLPAWSPDGEWLVAGVRPLDGGVALQLWQFRPDGSSAQPLTEDALFTWGMYRWDPTSQWLVAQRLELQKSYATPELILWNRTTGEMRPLVSNATFPAWLP
jgi:hypothetical protein